MCWRLLWGKIHPPWSFSVTSAVTSPNDSLLCADLTDQCECPEKHLALQLSASFPSKLTCHQLLDFSIDRFPQQPQKRRDPSHVLHGYFVLISGLAVNEVPQCTTGILLNLQDSMIQEIHQVLDTSQPTDLESRKSAPSAPTISPTSVHRCKRLLFLWEQYFLFYFQKKQLLNFTDLITTWDWTSPHPSAKAEGHFQTLDVFRESSFKSNFLYPRIYF